MALLRQVAQVIAMTAFYRSAAVRPVADAWLDLGGLPQELLSDIGVSPIALLDPRAWVDRGACFRLVNEISARSGDSLVGLHLADKLDWQVLGSWAEDIVSAPTIGRALGRASGKMQLLQSSSLLELLTDHDRACLRLTYAPPFEDRPDQYLLADLLILKRIFDLGAAPIRVSVRTVVQKPREIDEVARLLGPDIEFGAATNDLIFDVSALDMPLREGAERLVMKPELAAGKRETGHHVAIAIDRWLEFEPLTLSLIARHLGMSVRTVQRHLHLWGVSFEALLDQHRQGHALELLGREKCSVTETAFRLGYSDSAHFTRAFKRWFGVPPSRCDQVPSGHTRPSTLSREF